ncbi:MAG TPA: hypothetical protein GX736_06175 [Mogibacterium sp.]|nr:hypothetical protein [Mogibacterium sp.]
MNPQIETSVEAKIKVFTDYFDVPADVLPEMETLIANIKKIGERSQDVLEFEAIFAKELQEEYNTMFQKLTPKPVGMTEEQKAQSKAMADEFAYGTTDPVKIAAKKAGRVAMYAADSVAMKLESEAISAGVKAEEEAMKKAGVYDEYKSIEHTIDNIGTIRHFLKNVKNKK